jgi:hypothetical protein
VKGEVHVTADYECSGLEVRWTDDPQQQLLIAVPEELGISPILCSRLRCWQRWFDGVFELCGVEERFEVLGERFDEIGQQLAKQVAAELGPDFRVLYGPQGGWCLQMGRGKRITIYGGETSQLSRG